VQLSLDIAAAPDGLVYIPDFITVDEEVALLAAMALIDWQKVVMHGTAARRTVAHFGVTYGYSSWRLEDAPPLPPWAVPLLPRVAAAMREPPNALGELLASCYPEGARIGWHRDAPMFGPAVIGISLGAPCVMRFRRRGESRTSFKLPLERRSAYVLGGASRTDWQHTISPQKEERYSITFRTIKQRTRPRRSRP
jgi:alkylated DNA repair dioxygenase AlkB